MRGNMSAEIGRDTRSSSPRFDRPRTVIAPACRSPPSGRVMHAYNLSHLSDQTLLRDLSALVVRDNATTAELLAHLAEVEDRNLYVPAGYKSMYLFCVGEFGLSEGMALKRIRAARVARRFPAAFDAVAEGRLNVSAIVM